MSLFRRGLRFRTLARSGTIALLCSAAVFVAHRLFGQSPDAVPTAAVYIQKPIAASYAAIPSTTLADLRATEAEDFGHYLTARIPATDAASFTDRAAAAGFAARVAPEFDEIRLRHYTIPGMAMEASGLPADLRITDYSGATGLYLVQFRSPVREEWMRNLQAIGARTIHYLPANTYLVAASPQARAGFGSVNGSRHVVVYQPAYKLDPALLVPSLPTSRVLVQLDREQAWETLVADAERISPEPISYGELGPYVNLEATFDSATVKALAFDSRVIWMEPVTDVSLSDERGCQVVAGNHNGQQASGPGGYKTFLAGKCAGCLLDATAGTYVVNVMDTGLDRGSTQPVHPDLTGRVHSWADYYCPGCGQNAESRASHGEIVAGIVGGDPTGTGATVRDDLNFFYGSGVAPKAKVRVSRVFGPFLEPLTGFGSSSLLQVTKDAYNAGARIQNQSWNTGDSDTAPTLAYDAFAQTVDFLVRDAHGTWSSFRPMFIAISAGNSPYAVPPAQCPSCIASPANAKNAVAVGASTENRTGGSCSALSRPINRVAALSSRTAYFDGNRFKPDFVAPGTRVVSAHTTHASPTYVGLCPISTSGLVAGTNNRYGYGAGTSYAAPHAAGLAALYSRYHRKLVGVDPSPAMLRTMMIISAESMNGGIDDKTGFTLSHVPSHTYGHGRLGMKFLFDASPSSKFGDEDHGVTPLRRLVPSQTTLTFTMTVADPSKEIRVAMAYTDYPAAINANSTSVNLLSMYVLQGGFIYCDGAPMDSQGYSIRSTGCFLPDWDNTMKFIRIKPNSFTGTFQVQVSGALNAKAVPGLDGTSNNQDLAMWVWNAY